MHREDTEHGDQVADSSESAPNDTQKPTHEPFGWQHALAIVIAIGVTAGIYLLRDQVQRFQELAYLGAFLTMLLTSATIILPAPGIIFVFALGSHLNPLLVGLAGGLGAALGEMTGYLAGYGASTIADRVPNYDRIARWVSGRWGLGFIALLAFIPNPAFDMAGLVAGTLRLKWWHFLLAALIGKTTRSILVAYGGSLSMDWVEQLFT